MGRFFFHTLTNGTLVEDTIGKRFDHKIGTCIDAIAAMPSKLEHALNGSCNTYVTTEVRDEVRSLCIIRATIVIEERDARPPPAPTPEPPRPRRPRYPSTRANPAARGNRPLRAASPAARKVSSPARLSRMNHQPLKAKLRVGAVWRGKMKAV
jgi:hypothetical protein